MRLPKRRQVPRQDVPVPEFGERQVGGFIRQRPACNQVPPAVIEVLREFFDDLALARRREVQRR